MKIHSTSATVHYICNMYPLLRQLLFNFPPEKVHHISMDMMKTANRFRLTRGMLQGAFQYRDPSLKRNVFGIDFPNPVGLGAGFDKNALYLDELSTLGFGFVEIGTVTPLPQSGNEQPRLFRLPGDKALVNRMGFNNNGARAVAGRLNHWRNTSNHLPMIVGGNIGKNKITPNEEAWKDYETCFEVLFDTVDFFVVNVSSPNTPGLRELQEKDSLRKILSNLQDINNGKRNRKPLLLKIAPDLTNEQLDDIIELSKEVKLDGLVATNTTISRQGLKASPGRIEEIGIGGLSGIPLRERSTQVVKYIHEKTGGSIPIMASGGIFTGEDAIEKLNAGAILLQVWTGFIYEGPGIAKNICKYLSRHYKQHSS